MMGYRGVKFDETGQNILASTYLIQLKAKEYKVVWPDSGRDRQARMADEGVEVASRAARRDVAARAPPERGM